jgi:hypothetical protein
MTNTLAYFAQAIMAGSEVLQDWLEQQIELLTERHLDVEKIRLVNLCFLPTR